MNAIAPFRLLILNESQQEAQRLTSMFQNAGRPCRAQHITSQEAFNKIIEEQRWDLAIAHCGAKSPTPAEAIRTIRKYNHDLPLILLTDDNADRSVIDGMKLGAVDVVQLDDDQHLLLVVSRELINREYRKNTRIAERKLRELERRNQKLLDSSKDGIAFIQDGTFIYTNDSFAEMCGYQARDDIEYAPIMDLVSDEDRDELKRTLKNFVLNHEKTQDNRLRFQIKGADEQLRSIDVSILMSQFEEESCIQFFINAQVADTEIFEAEIESIKLTDTATGLHNKTSFNQKLNELVTEASDDSKVHALVYIDLDKFKQKVESVVGLDGADNVLATAAGFIQAQSHPDDFLARVGDDSFAIISNETRFENLLNIGNSICENIRSHFFEVDNKTIRLSASIGITLINETTIDTQSAINQATQAIETLRHKKEGAGGDGDGVNIYQVEADDQTILVGSLQKALNENRFKLLFQPIISLRGDETERYEVLLRMLDEEGEEISPSRFLNTAESMQANTKIDRWVLLEAIKHLSKHNKRTGEAQLLVHLSHHTLCDESLPSWLKVAFHAAKVDPGSIMLQAKEVDINDHLTAAKRFIEETSSLGINFCVSNFGCALDQMGLLEHIDVEHIKIDGSFPIEIQENPNSSAAMENILKELQSRKKIITVPMVENASILSNLWKMGVHCIQGNYLQPPGAAMDYEFAVENSA